MSTGTLLLSQELIERLLTPGVCIAAIEDAFHIKVGQLAAASLLPSRVVCRHPVRKDNRPKRCFDFCRRKGAFHV